MNRKRKKNCATLNYIEYLPQLLDDYFQILAFVSSLDIPTGIAGSA